MKHRAISLLCVFILVATAAMGAAKTASQQAQSDKLVPVKPDMQKIEQEVNNPKSPYYYPKLIRHFESNDTMMTLEQYRHLYLGYIFQEEYNPYRHSEYSKRVEQLYYKPRHTKADCDSIIKYAQLSLKDNPFDLPQINYYIYALRQKKKENLANIWQFRMNHLLQAIVSTGTGIDPENAWYVITPQHEYFIINLLGRQVEGHEIVPPYYERISLTPRGEKDPDAYYFNIRYIIEEYNRKYPDAD